MQNLENQNLLILWLILEQNLFDFQGMWLPYEVQEIITFKNIIIIKTAK